MPGFYKALRQVNLEDINKEEDINKGSVDKNVFHTLQ